MRQTSPITSEHADGVAAPPPRSSRTPRQGRRASIFKNARLLVGTAFAWILASPLRAHDIYSSWAEAVVHSDRLELTLTLARASALRLVPNSNVLPPITPENFSSYAPKLKSVAPELFEITIGGRPLKLAASDVKISGDADITFHLVYSRPASGALRFAVSYLFQLVDGHVGTLVVTGAAGKDLGWSPVSVDQPVFEVRVPASNP